MTSFPTYPPLPRPMAPTPSGFYRPAPPAPMRFSDQEAHPSPPALHIEAKPSRRLFDYVGPFQAVALVAGGVATAVAAGVFLRGFWAPQWAEGEVYSLWRKIKKVRPKISTANSAEAVQTAAPKKRRVVERHIGYAGDAVGSVLMFGINSPKPIKDRVLAYFGAMGLGYVAGKSLEGVQEIWVRREETQIRADLLRRLTRNFRDSIHEKMLQDQKLRAQARQDILLILRQGGVQDPESLLTPWAATQRDVALQARYTGEPVHYERPNPVSYGMRFGLSKSAPRHNRADESTIASPTALQLPNRLFRAGLFGTGLAGGLVAQYLWGMLKSADIKTEKAAMVKFFETNLVVGREAFILTAPRHMLLSALGLVAAAKVGKMLMNGYTEIEVTRQHSLTEEKYQIDNFHHIENGYRNAAEEEYLAADLRQLRLALPTEASNRAVLSNRIQTILINIGRNSAPKYMMNTPYVGLVNARG